MHVMSVSVSGSFCRPLDHGDEITQTDGKRRQRGATSRWSTTRGPHAPRQVRCSTAAGLTKSIHRGPTNRRTSGRAGGGSDGRVPRVMYALWRPAATIGSSKLSPGPPHHITAISHQAARRRRSVRMSSDPTVHH